MKDKNQLPADSVIMNELDLPGSNPTLLGGTKQVQTAWLNNETMFKVLGENYRKILDDEQKDIDLYGHNKPDLSVEELLQMHPHTDCDDLVAADAVMDYLRTQLVLIKQLRINGISLG